MSVFVLDTNRKPQNPVHPAKARLLLTKGKAAVFRPSKMGISFFPSPLNSIVVEK